MSNNEKVVVETQDTAESAAECIAATLGRVRAENLPDEIVDVVRRDLVDVVGLMVAARNNDYVQSIVEGVGKQEPGPCSAVAHPGSFGAATAGGNDQRHGGTR